MRKLTEKQQLIREMPSERSIIYNAFHWHEAPEGHDFWKKINEDYVKLFK